MKKNNFFNRLFYRRQLCQQQQDYLLCCHIIEYYGKLSEEIRKSTSLTELLSLHQNAWQHGYRSRAIAPDPFGVFRTESIETMTAGEVFLGDIYGLWTNPITFWEKHKEDKYGANGFGLSEDILIYELILKQYKDILRKGINDEYNRALHQSAFLIKNHYASI